MNEQRLAMPGSVKLLAADLNIWCVGLMRLLGHPNLLFGPIFERRAWTWRQKAF
jgi:hypothetical protein